MKIDSSFKQVNIFTEDNEQFLHGNLKVVRRQIASFPAKYYVKVKGDCSEGLQSLRSHVEDDGRYNQFNILG